MDTNKANTLNGLYREILDEIEDLVPKDESLQVEKDLTRIWNKKNLFRNGVRDLVAALPTDDVNRVKWEKCSKDLVDKVIKHKKEVRAQVERLNPTERLTELRRCLDQMS